ncbi:MAG: LytTR family DNA-binding domain-containing protein [Sphingobacteriales bacterium JAD_PAG50586_3]|nr:MAG: LytTR family DNA-binding domain-containing protein [Sphingobacteriales bacterium JAD_PAG50586_3]
MQLNGEIGLDLVNYLTKDEINFEIIFTTAYSGYALDAFTLSATDYILKPINAERLKEAVARVLKRAKVRVEQLQILQQVATTQTIERIVLKTHQGSHIVAVKDIQFLKADNVYTEFHLGNGTQVIVSKPLKEYEILLTQAQFFKPHRSYIINTNYIKRYSKAEAEIELRSGVKVPVSRDKKKEFETLMGIV